MEINAVIGVNKPKGFTSFDVVAKLRKILKTKKIGHAGTLDPLATGVLPILVGKATKLCDLICDNYKEYVADFKLGVLTDTLDITGKILLTSSVSVSKLDIKNALQKYLGEFYQTVPMYSAVKVNGQKLYNLARKGQEVERPKKLVKISKLELKNYDPQANEGRIIVGCSRGTYIRSLIDDLGKDLGCYATMINLCRIKSCGINLTETVTLDELEKAVNEGKFENILLNMDYFLKEYREYNLSLHEKEKFSHGAILPIADSKFKDQELLRVYYSGQFLGLAKVDLGNQKLKIVKLLIS
jgi:tRNA pseudouridine55 synthase